MGYFQRIAMAPTRFRAEGGGAMDRYTQAFFAGDPVDSWLSTLTASGVAVTPELALTLSAMYSGVATIAMDLATLPMQIFKYRDDGGKDRVRGGRFSGAGGIGSLVTKLRWAPNDYQTATEYELCMLVQFLLREIAYAEIVNGPDGFLQQLLPRHPDRVRAERLPNGRIRYRLTEANGTARYLTQDEMHVVRGLTMDGLTPMSRVTYGAESLGSALSTQRAAGKFFKSGMTAAMLATYPGDPLEGDRERDLHQSISRFAAGVENSFGLMLVPDDVKISNLAVDPEKAQMMLAQEWGVREVARLLRLPGHKLGIKDSVSYNSQVQAAIDYVVGCLRPIAVVFEQAMQRDLILAKDTYFVEIQMGALLRGDPAQQAEYFDKLIRARVMRPSEARLLLNMNPDAELDRLSASDFQPGKAGGAALPKPADQPTNQPTQPPQKENGRLLMRGVLALHDTALRCVRRERAAVEKLAKKHAADVAGWQAGLRDFYADHAGFVAETMRLSIDQAREYAAQHGSAFETKGTIIIDGDAGTHWEREEATALAALAVDEDRLAA